MLSKKHLYAAGLLLVAGVLGWQAAPGQTGDKKKKGGRPGEIITPAAKGERHKDSLKVGHAAPDFTLPLLHEKKEVTLSCFREMHPVVLIFGSYT